MLYFILSVAYIVHVSFTNISQLMNFACFNHFGECQLVSHRSSSLSASLIIPYTSLSLISSSINSPNMHVLVLGFNDFTILLLLRLKSCYYVVTLICGLNSLLNFCFKHLRLSFQLPAGAMISFFLLFLGCLHSRFINKRA